MTIQLRKEIDTLKNDILNLGFLVEESLRNAMISLKDHNAELAQQVISEDDKIDEMEIEIEESCLKVLALHQPVAIDLRYIVATLKINSDLERIGDLSANIASRAKSLSKAFPIEYPADLFKMFGIVKKMLKMSLESLIYSNTETATEVLEMDVEVDDIHRNMYKIVKKAIKKEPDILGQSIQLLTLSRYLERCADHCTNICEDVIYLVEGRIVRHSQGD